MSRTNRDWTDKVRELNHIERVEITKFDKQNGVSGFHVILEFGKTHYVGAGKDNPKLKDFKNFEITLPIAK